MKSILIKSYIKYHYGDLILSGIIILIGIIAHDSISSYLIFPVIWISRSIYHFEDRLKKIDKLKSKGLTEEDVSNIAFVKKWEESRKNGLWTYCIKDGGIIAGAILAIPVSLLYFMISHKNILELFPGPGAMFSFIAYAYLAGAAISIISYRVLWIINERRFLRLTDPLNTIFTDKKESFSDLI